MGGVYREENLVIGGAWMIGQKALFRQEMRIGGSFVRSYPAMGLIWYGSTEVRAGHAGGWMRIDRYVCRMGMGGGEGGGHSVPCSGTAFFHLYI